MTGIYWHEAKGGKFRFITLTGLDLNEQHYKSKLYRIVRFLRRLIGQFEYFATRTYEGRGVYHIVYVGKSVKYGTLRKEWRRITGSDFVHISRITAGNYRRISLEMTRQNATASYSRSSNWIPVGLLDERHRFKGKDITAWINFVKTYRPIVQSTITSP